MVVEGLLVVPRHPVFGMGGDLLGVAEQLRQVLGVLAVSVPELFY